jgi:hypothetical protein
MNHAPEWDLRTLSSCASEYRTISIYQSYFNTPEFIFIHGKAALTIETLRQ